MTEEQTTVSARTAPYIPYKTFRTFIEDIRQQGLPLRFDPSALQRFSGTVRTQLLSALRFLDLVDDNNEPRAKLKTLHEATELEHWRDMMAEVLDKAYPQIMGLNLAQITPAHLNQGFREHYKAKDQVAQKQVTFFINAAKDAGIELSGRILNKTRTRTKTTRRTTPAAKKSNGADQKAINQDGKGKNIGTGAQSGLAPPGMIRMPVPLGKDRLAYIDLPENWEKAELGKLLKILQLSLGDDVEE